MMESFHYSWKRRKGAIQEPGIVKDFLKKESSADKVYEGEENQKPKGAGGSN